MSAAPTTPIAMMRAHAIAGAVPKHNMDAERAVLSTVLTIPETLEGLRFLEPRDFYSDLHKRFWRMLVKGIDAGKDTTDPAWLLSEIHNASPDVRRTILELYEAPGQASNVKAYAQTVRGLSVQRQVVEQLHRALAAGYTAEPAEFLSIVGELSIELKAAAANGSSDALSAVGGELIVNPFEGELGEVTWIVPGLEICAGRPSVFAGYSGEGKSFFSYALGIAAATQRRVWGEFEVPRAMRVLIVDMEQGRRPTLKRIRRLAKGMGLSPSDFLDADGTSRLQVRSLPRASLLDSDAHEVLEAMTRGFDLVIFDSLKKMMPGADENSAEVEAYTRKLFEVSEATQRAFLVIVHTGKAKEGRSGVSLESLRGSSAMAGDFGSTWIVVYDKSTKTHTLHHAKASLESDGGKREPIVLAFKAGEADGSPEGTGLRIDAICAEELAERAQRAKSSGATGETSLTARIVAYVARNPGCGSHKLREELGGKKSTVDDAIAAALDAGLIHDRGTGADRTPRRFHVGQWPREHDSQTVASAGHVAPWPVAPLKGGATGATGHGLREGGPGPLGPLGPLGATGHQDNDTDDSPPDSAPRLAATLPALPAVKGGHRG